MGLSRAFELEEAEEENKAGEFASFMASGLQGNHHQQLDPHHQQQQQQQQHHQNHHQIQNQHNHQQHHHHDIQFATMNNPSSSSNIPSVNFIGSSKDSGGGAYEIGELDQALFLYLDGQQQQQQQVQDQRHQGSSGMRPPTLNIFPSQPMHVEPSSTKGVSVAHGIVSSVTGGSKRPILEPSMELANPRKLDAAAPSGPASKIIKREGNRKGPTTSSSEQEGPKTPDPKTLRRLAQNREAARKSRLRKKAYVQQLESSRIKLTQLEQELQRARTQGMIFGGGVGGADQQGVPVDAAVFDMEYARWLEEHHRLMCELRAAVQGHMAENELRLFVDNCLAHYDEMMNLKSILAKTDVFHIISGMWKTPAERCFLWMGDFRPSEVIKIVVTQIEPLTDQQLMAIYSLQQSTSEAEEALTQGLEALNQSLSDTIASDSLSMPPNMANYMSQMALALNKLSTLEGFVRQADNLRLQTLHRLQTLLTIRQSARCLLAITEYFHRLRALSSLWMGRPRQDHQT